MSAEDATGGLTRLIYLSRQRFQIPSLADEAVDDIIRTSIRNNRASNLTGLLLVHDGWFLQALEGPQDEVAAAYSRIVHDPRHANARVLEAGGAARREFSDWNMCARRMSDADEAILNDLEQHAGLALDRLDGRSALRLLKALRGIQHKASIQLHA